MIFQISAGLLAPIEVQLAVGKFLDYCYGIDKDLKVIDYNKYSENATEYANYRSVTFESDSTYFLNLLGTIKCVFKSPIRNGHKRKNWYISFNRILIDDLNTISAIGIVDVKYETCRASGCGGQHVNTTDSAVKATHILTGITAIAQEERSQHLNKKLAYKRLQLKLYEKYQEERAKQDKSNWGNHNDLVRGNETLTLRFNF